MRRQLISDHDGLTAQREFRDLTIERWPVTPSIERAYDLRETHAVGDGVYIALAEGLDAPLLTCDPSSPGHDAVIELA